MSTRALRSLYDFWWDMQAVRLIRHAEGLPYYAKVLDDQGVQQARQLIASVYVQKGVVPQASLQIDGTMSDKADPYWRHATYIGVYDCRQPDTLLMAMRLIHPLPKVGVDSLQIKVEQLDPVFRDRIRRMQPGTIAELAGYIKNPGLGPLKSRIAMLYMVRQLVFESRKQGITIWVFGLRPELQKKYELFFGPAMDRQGDHVQLGSLQALFIPYSVDVEKSARYMLRASRLRPGSKAIARFTAAAFADGDTA